MTPEARIGRLVVITEAEHVAGPALQGTLEERAQRIERNVAIAGVGQSRA